MTTTTMTPDDVLRSLPTPPKNLIGKEGQIVSALRAKWIEDCAGKCTNAALTQPQITWVFLGWLKKGNKQYAELITNHVIKKLLKPERPKRDAEVNHEITARRVISTATNLPSKLAAITGAKIAEVGNALGDTTLTISETWKNTGVKRREAIAEIMEDIQRQLLLSDGTASEEATLEAAEAPTSEAAE